jgi:hypothetical protein
MRSVLEKRFSSTFSPCCDLLTDQGSFKGALNAFVAEGRALEDLGA